MSYAGDVLRAAASEMPTDPTDARAWLTARAHALDAAENGGFPACASRCDLAINNAHEIRILKGLPASFTGDRPR